MITRGDQEKYLAQTVPLSDPRAWIGICLIALLITLLILGY